MLVRESSTGSANDAFGGQVRPHYCCGGIGRDDGGAVGDRDEGGGTVDLCPAVAGGCGGGSGIFISISTTADSSLAISRVVWS